jgi:hypothetical protein
MNKKLIELFAVTSLEFNDAVTLADHLIANDVVPVVRCKDCKHCITDQNIIGGYGDCLRFDPVNKNSIVQADDFCSYGERREGE